MGVRYSIDATDTLPKIRLSTIVATIIIVLLLVFYVTTFINVRTITESIESIRTGAYPVSVAAGRIETRLVQLETVAQRPIYVRSERALESLHTTYHDIDDDIQAYLQVIETHGKKDSSQIFSLMESYAQLQRLLEEYITLCNDEQVSDDEIAQFNTEQINPLINELLAKDVAILDETSGMVEETYSTSSTSGAQTMLMASVLMAAVVVSLIIYLNMLRTRWAHQRELQKSLEDACRRAEEANEAKSRFLSNMSHDIRTPMNAIVGLTSIAQTHSNDPARVTECLDRIAISSKHLLSLINDVLDMSKIDSGKIVLNEETFDLSEIITEVVTIAQPQAHAKRLKFDIITHGVSTEMVRGDSMRLNQALVNILSNAVKYTNPGGTVRLIIEEKPSDTLGFHDFSFIIQDSGIGMSEEFVNRVFEPFERDSGVEKANIEGTGLGMAITKNVVTMMNGTIDVQSVLGEGTTFAVTIPLKIVDSNAAHDEPHLQPWHFLVVDDEGDVARETVALLDSLGLSGRYAQSGQEALDILGEANKNSETFDAIMVDWVMPGMDGLDLACAIRDMVPNKPPIIMLTSYDWTEVEDDALDAGIMHFISKPLFPSRLTTALELIQNNAEKTSSKAKREPAHVEGRILLVEDNELNMEIAEELIRQRGAEVEHVCDGGEAVQRMSEVPEGYYDLIFMDMKMPEMDGIEATQRILANAQEAEKATPPIIAMTANAFSDDRKAALESGMEDFMTKPIDVRELDRVLVNYLRKA